MAWGSPFQPARGARGAFKLPQWGPILVLSRRDRTPLAVMFVMLFDKPENVQ